MTLVREAARTDPVRDRARRLVRPGLVAAAVAAGTAYVWAVDPNSPGHYPLCPTYAIAGIYSANKRVLGMMPHPENLIEALHGGLDGRGLFESVVRSLAA